MKNQPIWLAGYDTRGIVFVEKDQVIRKISPEYLHVVKDLFEFYLKYNLVKSGIVKTTFDYSNLRFVHEKHIISYPFEWTANMIKTALLFHLKLFVELDKYGLTLKDAIPNNIVFKYTKPIFIDFLSIIRTTNLDKEDWLVNKKNYSDLRFAVFNNMLLPFMLIPFIAMAEKNFCLARKLLAEHACNGRGRAPIWDDLYGRKKFVTFAFLKKIKLKQFLVELFFTKRNAIKTNINIHNIRQTISSTNNKNFIDYCSEIIKDISEINVTPPSSSYSNYYEFKNENFDYNEIQNWNKKQKVIASLLELDKPNSLLDIGANTGWFSVLAAKKGVKVIATDIDESSIDCLYLYSLEHGLNILPLLIPFEHMTRKIFGLNYEDSVYNDRDFKSTPLFLPATKRLNSEIVLCLGLLHHLVLGCGFSLQNICQILYDLTIKKLVLEFIDLSDPLIQAEPSFFGHIGEFTESNYNMRLVISQLRMLFKSCDVYDSNPESRKLLICMK